MPNIQYSSVAWPHKTQTQNYKVYSTIPHMSVICLIPYNTYILTRYPLVFFILHLLNSTRPEYIQSVYFMSILLLLLFFCLTTYWNDRLFTAHADDIKIFNISWIFMFTFWFLPKDYRKKEINIQHFIRILPLYVSNQICKHRQTDTHTSRHLSQINLCISIIKWIWWDDAGC